MKLMSAIVPTAHAAKYMTQLCKHWSHRFEVELTEASARVILPGGLVSFKAASEALEIDIEPNSEETRENLKSVVAEHLNRFAFREAPLTFNWT